MGKSKFILIYNALSEKIHKQEIAAGSLLPTENELGEQFKASRETIRKALAMLSRNGYIQKIQGKGSIVLDVSRQNFPISGLTSFRELANHSKDTWRTNVHQLVLMKPDDHLKMVMNLHDDQMVWKVIRSRSVNGEAVILDKDYLIQGLVPILTADICEHSLYDYIENDLGLKIGFAKKEITVEHAGVEDKRYLTMSRDTHVVVVRSLVYLESAELFQFTESRHRADKFRFVDFARREHQ
ncbi:trehalose operon repressor [Sporolactobacillus shoreicorticis]|uniref:Trehalose operon repressor n=1 Tax=Sporolactobacillus shoreicorticis TaxID=1923877 RepID=A0ABW5RYC9_9BACL|nr:trehalose operon repressor [Sporolactobacillus shoreicorticis]MCO7125071.1 trehalose operon repressor [Sporolactobacillus shoreicorticis]